MRRLLMLLCWLFVFAHSLGAQDWPQWRGPTRDGRIAAAPTAWPARYAPDWRVEVGEGYSSPVVAAGLVFVHSRRDPDEIVTAIDAARGRIIWQQRYAATFEKNQYAVRMAKGTAAFEVEKKYDVSDEETWAMPALVGRDFVFRDAMHVVKLVAK